MKLFHDPSLVRRYPSVWVLILVNLIPAFGVLFMEWKVLDVILIYVIETAIIGVLNILKMIFCTQLQETEPTKQTAGLTGNVSVFKFFLIPFFTVHYFGFVVIQTIFVLLFLNESYHEIQFNEMYSQVLDFCITNPETRLSVGGLFASHFFSFLSNYIGKREYTRTGLARLMTQPYVRIFIQQAVVIGGAILMSIFNTPDAFVLLLVVLKIIADVRMHLKEHQEYGL